MSSIHALLNSLFPDSNIKGKRFEKICHWFLRNNSEWRVLHRLNFSSVIERELLTDYQVVIAGVDNPMIAEWITQREFVTVGDLAADAQTLAAHIGLLKVMRDYDLKRLISFHGRVNRAQAFAADALQKISCGNIVLHFLKRS